MKKILEAKNLSYKIEQFEILKNIDFSVREGEFVGLIGPNGSGKTSLLKHFYRAILPEINTLWLKGKKIEEYTQNAIAKNITVMKQENSSDFDYTVEQMVLMGRSPYLKPYMSFDRNDLDIAIHSLEKVGMSESRKRYFSSLSGGEKQRVLIARALAQDTDILILDEPTNHLDIYYQLYLMQILSKLSKTIVSVFHDLNLAAKYCDYIYVLKEGEVVDKGKTQEVINEKMLKQVFGVSSTIIEGGDAFNIAYNYALVNQKQLELL